MSKILTSFQAEIKINGLTFIFRFDVALNDFLDHNVLIDGIVAIVTMDKEDMELKR